MKNIQIVSDGTPAGTNVYALDDTGLAVRIEGVSKIEFEPFDTTSELLVAKLTIFPRLVNVKAKVTDEASSD